jgi:hypothetical protein
VYNAVSGGREPFLPVLLPQHSVCTLVCNVPCGMLRSRRRSLGWGASSVGRALRSQRRGRGFNSRALHQIIPKLNTFQEHGLDELARCHDRILTNRKAANTSSPNIHNASGPQSRICYVDQCRAYEQKYGVNLVGSALTHTYCCGSYTDFMQRARPTRQATAPLPN